MSRSVLLRSLYKDPNPKTFPRGRRAASYLTGYDNGHSMVKRLATTTETVALGAATSDVKKAKKGDQAWMYPNGVIRRATHLDLKNYTDHERPDGATGLPRRKIESNFLITLNTHQSMKNYAKAFACTEACEDAMKELATEKSIMQYLKFGPKNSHYQGDKYCDVIESVEFRYGVEQGEVQHKLHAHAYMTVHHYSQVQVNMPILGSMFKTEYNRAVESRGAGKAMPLSKKPYVHVKLLPTSDWAMVIRQYMVKAMV